MAVRIVRQYNQIALIGVPTSAAGRSAGQERAPAALRAAGLAERLRGAGYDVTDLGDIPIHVYEPDEESPRARNIRSVVAALEELKPRVEQAYKSGALPLILGGDCTIALATLAGVRRYHHTLSLLYFDADADLNTPATTPSGCLEGMGVAHIVGRGAPELVRFWSEPPLVREPDVTLFGVFRLDPPERELLERSAMRRYPVAEVGRRGVVAAAQAALEGLHTGSKEFVLHFDVDAISSEDFAATELPGEGGLRLEEVRQALEIFAGQKNLAALEIAEYNPERDTESRGAQLLLDLLVSALAARRTALTAPEATAAAPAEPADLRVPPAEAVLPARGEDSASSAEEAARETIEEEEKTETSSEAETAALPVPPAAEKQAEH